MEVAECKVKEVEHELASQSDAFTRLQNDKETLEEECRVSSESLRDLRAEVAGLRTELEKLQNERTKEKERLMNEMETIVSEKNKTSEAILQEMTSAKELHEKEMSKLKEQVTRYKKRYEEGEEEKDLIKEELKSVQGMVEQETASLRFELSSNNMQLQQTLKVRTNGTIHVLAQDTDSVYFSILYLFNFQLLFLPAFIIRIMLLSRRNRLTSNSLSGRRRKMFQFYPTNVTSNLKKYMI